MVEPSLSTERLDAYAKPGEPRVETLARYFWNLKLGEALFPSLQCLEVALRNAMHSAFTNTLSDAHWLIDPTVVVDPWARTQVEKAIKELTRGSTPAPTGAPPKPGAIVAQLSFGFWTHLFNTEYGPHPFQHHKQVLLWPRHLGNVFPNAPKRRRTREELSRRLNHLRKLRNRVSHHEPIWAGRMVGKSFVSLLDEHAVILETIGWLSPEFRAATEVHDRFKNVYRHAEAPVLRGLHYHCKHYGYEP